MLKLSFAVPKFRCSREVFPHLERVFEGEYDVPLEFPHGPTVLDLGANVGAFSIWAAHRWPGAHIFAYEPHPKNIEIFRENTRGYPNVHLRPVGVGTPGTRILHNGRFNEGEHSFHQMANNPAPTGQHVEVIDPTLLPRADILKMDIEGCEAEVLPALLNDHRTFRGIMFEYHNEDLRHGLDALLVKDYALIGHQMYVIGRGTLKYIRKDLL